MVIESFAESILKIKVKLNSKELALLRGSLSMAIQEICPNGVLPKNNEELSLFKDYAYLIWLCCTNLSLKAYSTI
ncbi:hypothetical protein [Acinetobacter pittii]|uniref:hypothetical protein n=1 Tax=Acinetobacter pittii TaxID=48296 RepID=UPI000709B0D7|nr:hypothetical protein [Acinetobacter pittii]KRI80045.1 hypothetical protein APC68_09430 [Acinetobacter pittii]KRJ63621.1 hypothetical protein APC92_15615 [Acinetobacter pittii]